MKTREFFLALAVVAAAIATSCVKEQMDPQDKPGVQITGQVFEANHEVFTKSTLVDLTPTWVEGDKIYVSGANGEATCTFAEGNKFQTDENVNIDGPYYAIYPAAKGHSVDSKGIFTVNVPAEQVVKVGQNVAAGALAAVAASETTELHFKNVVGLVKINIKRNDITKVEIMTTAYENIAGTCTVDLNPDKENEGEAPAIKLVADKANKIILTHESGAFPAGEYYATIHPRTISGILVTFTRINGEEEESVTIKKAASTLVARNAGVDLGGFFEYEISSAEELLAWNKQVVKWTAWDVVTLTADIDCQGVINSDNWTPNHFGGVFNGNGKTINNFVIKKAGQAGFFKKLQDATVENLTFGEGCSVTALAAEASDIYAGSLAGEVRGGTTLKNVVNKGTVKLDADATGGTNGNYIGGLCGYFTSDGVSSITGCKNEGDVTVSSTPSVSIYCGGLAGILNANTAKFDNAVLTVTGCENSADVVYNGVNTAKKNIHLGGLVAAAVNAKVSLSSCTNLGSVQCAATTEAGSVNIGGIIATDNGSTLATVANCVNGSATDPNAGLLVNSAPATGQLNMGGCVAYLNKATTVNELKNYGTIKNTGAVTGWNVLGGVVGYIKTEKSTVSTCENHGQVLTETAKGRVSAGGIVGFIDGSDATVTACDNTAEVKNTAAASSGVSLGGVVGRIQAKENGDNTISDCDNTGAVTFAATSVKDQAMMSAVGGVIGVHAGPVYGSGDNRYHKSAKVTISGCNNTGAVTKNGAGSYNFAVGGIAGLLNGALESGQSYSLVSNITSCTNGENGKSTGAVLNASSGTNYPVYAGGIVGWHRAGGMVNGCKNYATVTNTSNTNGNVNVGGITGAANNGSMIDCVNGGTVKDDSNSNTGYVGGIAGYADVREMSMTNCDNTAVVSGKFNSGNKTAVHVGGVVAYSTKAVTLDGCDNSGEVTCVRTTTASHVYMGGLIADMPNVKVTLTNCNVSAKVNNTNANVESKTGLGGFVGFCYSNDIQNCHLKDVSITNASASNVYVGGFIGQIEGKDPISTNIVNCSAKVSVTPNNRAFGGVLVGRLTYTPTATKTVNIKNVAVVGGSCNGVELKEDNYTGYCYGSNTGNNIYKPLNGVYFGAFQNN